VKFLRSINEGTKYGYIIFPHLESIDDYWEANERRPVPRDIDITFVLKPTNSFALKVKKSMAALVMLSFLKFPIPGLANFLKTVDSVLDSLKTKKGFLHARAYKSIQSFEKE